MSWIDRGKRKLDYKTFKTFETERVQKRFDSILPVVQSKVEQALSIDSTFVIVYKAAKMGLTCSCNAIDNTLEGVIPGLEKGLATQGSDNITASIEQSAQTMFGGKSAAISLDDIGGSSDMLLHGADLMASGEDFDPNHYGGNNVNCGICFGQGLQPGYQPMGHQYMVLAHHHVVQCEGYHIDWSSQPCSFTRVVEKGFVEFETAVPKFFQKARFGIRANEDLLPAYHQLMVMVSNVPVPISLELLNKFRGQKILIRVYGVELFSHVSIVFDLGVEAIRANVSEEQNILNYDQELTVGNLTVILPARLGSIGPEDLIIVPARNYVLKVIEAPKKRTATGHMWEWVLTTRVLQRSEFAFGIHKGVEIR